MGLVSVPKVNSHCINSFLLVLLLLQHLKQEILTPVLSGKVLRCTTHICQAVLFREVLQLAQKLHFLDQLLPLLLVNIISQG